MSKELEQENANLREILARTTKYLSPTQRTFLAVMLNKPVSDGGVSKNQVEIDWERVEQVKGYCDEAAQLLVYALSSTDENGNAKLDKEWEEKALKITNQLINYEPPSPAANLAILRNSTETAA
jgi:hypothetical protein